VNIFYILAVRLGVFRPEVRKYFAQPMINSLETGIFLQAMQIIRRKKELGRNTAGTTPMCMTMLILLFPVETMCAGMRFFSNGSGCAALACSPYLKVDPSFGYDHSLMPFHPLQNRFHQKTHGLGTIYNE
jgi:hypothetical protein